MEDVSEIALEGCQALWRSQRLVRCAQPDEGRFGRTKRWCGLEPRPARQHAEVPGLGGADARRRRLGLSNAVLGSDRIEKGGRGRREIGWR